jgi:xanthine dehydrogenase/oxidase
MCVGVMGQIEGAFTQGMGFYTMEEVVWMHDGKMFTRGPSTYKIPSFEDTPRDMRVTLARDVPNPRLVFSSKACHPPFVRADAEGDWRAAAAAGRVRVLCD